MKSEVESFRVIYASVKSAVHIDRDEHGPCNAAANRHAASEPTAPVTVAVAVPAALSGPPAASPRFEDRNAKEILAAAQRALKQNWANVMRVRLGYRSV
jgi:hypothetical protein